jgi:putative flippase GtrA
MINQISLYILVDLLSIEIITSKVIAIVITFFWNYFTRNNFIFLFRERIKY